MSAAACACTHGKNWHSADGCAAKNGHDVYCDCSWVPPAVKARDRAARLKLHRQKNACPAHAAYDCAAKPVTDCEACWAYWFRVQYAALIPHDFRGPA